jgi:hypothetical protein
MQQTRLATARHRESRDMLRAAISATKKKKQEKQSILPPPLDNP